VPNKALDPAAESFRKLDHFSPSQVIENRLAAALANMEAAGVSR
jgi:hypothetical protein